MPSNRTHAPNWCWRCSSDTLAAVGTPTTPWSPWSRPTAGLRPLPGVRRSGARGSPGRERSGPAGLAERGPAICCRTRPRTTARCRSGRVAGRPALLAPRRIRRSTRRPRDGAIGRRRPHGTGTAALLLHAADSAASPVRTGIREAAPRVRGPRLEGHWPGLRLDVDTADDLGAAHALGVGAPRARSSTLSTHRSLALRTCRARRVNSPSPILGGRFEG